MRYIEHFGDESAQYKLFRPSYPKRLFTYLNSMAHPGSTVWDCATGSGQAALALAENYKVIATDINQAQLDEAPEHRAITYLCCPAERTPLADNSIDMITVAQALHWFNLDGFYREVMRVSRPEGVIAAWCYALGKVTKSGSSDDKLNSIIDRLYNKILGDEYWPVQRHFIDEEYQTIPFPFEKIATPEFYIEKDMAFDQLLGYLRTWSAVKEYQVRNNEDPVGYIRAELEAAWGDTQSTHTMVWPLHLLAAKTKTYKGY
ncbi:class I SAM-dependent methyltransferase [Legionella dresdenensis]|uniref:Class I SAM-dependent methyltransferase n=1 Tax=Legionella dresdenensis TaxID=450200 RepID=A0ABV8CGR0_9GAMM